MRAATPPLDIAFAMHCHVLNPRSCALSWMCLCSMCAGCIPYLLAEAILRSADAVAEPSHAHELGASTCGSSQARTHSATTLKPCIQVPIGLQTHERRPYRNERIPPRVRRLRTARTCSVAGGVPRRNVCRPTHGRARRGACDASFTRPASTRAGRMSTAPPPIAPAVRHCCGGAAAGGLFLPGVAAALSRQRISVSSA